MLHLEQAAWGKPWLSTTAAAECGLTHMMNISVKPKLRNKPVFHIFITKIKLKQFPVNLLNARLTYFITYGDRNYILKERRDK